MDMFSYVGAVFLDRAEKLGLKWNWKNAEKFLLPEYEEYENKRGLFFYVHNEYRPGVDLGKRYAVQHEFRPDSVEIGSPAHDIYLNFTNSLDYRTNSSQVYASTKKLWHQFPEMFTHEACERLSFKDVEHALQVVRYSFPTQGAERWMATAKTTFENLDGDPVKIFKNGAENIDELMSQRQLIQKTSPHYLWGKGPKLLSLLAIMYEEFGRIPPFPRSYPVDLHVQRILCALEIVSWEGSVEMDASVLAEYCRHKLVEFHELHKMNTLRSAHMLWFRGNGLCQNCMLLRAERPNFLREMCSLYRIGCGGPKFHTGTYSQERIWSERAILNLEIAHPDVFRLVPPEARELRRVRHVKKIREPSNKPVPKPEDFELISDEFFG